MPTALIENAAETAMLMCSGIHMSFGGVPVLKGIDLSLEPGTVTALAGENGAGKSTLMKIASGQYRPDSGSVEVRGAHLPAGDTRAAASLGVAIVPQELASIPELTVYENLFVGVEKRTPFGTLDRRGMVREAKSRLAGFGLDTDPTVRMGSLPVGIRQIIEIVKATSRGARVLLLDEPTSAIAEREVARLIDVVRSLRDQGVAVMFTTHKMEEIRAMADRVIVLRDGSLVSDTALADITDDGIVTAMIGRELDNLFPDLPPAGDQVVLEVEGLVAMRGADPIDFSVRRGEILGLAGLVGAGRTELLECIYGVRKPVSGRVKVNGRVIKPGDPLASIASHLAIVPEDRKGAGAVLSLSVLDNAILPRIGAFSRWGVLARRGKQGKVQEVMRSMRLKSNGLGQTLEHLSGGNQQKVVLGRWLTGRVDALLLDEPTRGVDVGARNEIYRIVTELSAAGMAVVMASSDMPEILSLSHRAFVLRGFSVAGELSREQLADPGVQDVIFRLASGQDASAQAQEAQP
ncbi:sugar ABC transporter ATP-binding protein [Sinomonas sp. ASV322]|uniref:sugar ABC transporter ATP-binding protein n=1 Tax=Sinomonas sp. ASV322 TaxID=3041920 RepID=UPI0027DE4DA6|nr:sugar ABC transporter ATP-binding protein [Sinomonas sp. ASV322]MDQ4504021.1 sugar ABC transporter ATP-binding protein [Sinomonas sp. ASV322]